jgi:hypothetical protein
MNHVELVQSIFSLPGGNGRYIDAMHEFLAWLEPRATTTREDAFGWFQDRFNAVKTAANYLPVLRDFGVVELERGRNGAIRLTEMGRAVLGIDRPEQARLLAERFMTHFVANREILGLFALSEHPLSRNEVHQRLGPRFPSWKTATQLDFRLNWFGSLGLLAPVQGRTFEITDQGREFARRYPPDPAASEDGQATVSREAASNPLESLLDELRAASTDSSKPVRFEAALARAFETLGFAVQQLGAAGDTDVLVEASIGDETYSVVVDAKARGSGKVDQLEVLSLKDHQASNRADYVVVVAGNFAGGKVAGHAQEQGITLLPLPVLEDWLRLHDTWPQDLLVYRSLFKLKGMVEKLPTDLLQVAKDRKRWGKLLADVVDLFSETYESGLTEPLSIREVFKMLVTRKRGVHYPEKDVAGIMELLGHPVVGALAKKDDGYILAMSRETLALRLRRLAEEVESLEFEGPAT